MDHRRFGSCYAVRIDRGEDIIESIKELCRKEGIDLASVRGIGSADSVTLGSFDSQKLTFVFKEFTGDLEIASIDGNITTNAGEVHPHIHMTVGCPEHGMTAAGHATQCRVSRTAEIFMHVYEGRIERELEKETGISLMSFLE